MSAPGPPRTDPLLRFSRRPNGDLDIHRVGRPRDGWRDVYYFVLIQPWAVFYLVLIACYLLINCGFATLYSLQPGCIGEAHPGLWLEDFFFSFETISTVGYGVMHPVTLYGHWVVASEIMVGVLMVPLLTGLTILKFARPTARVAFSRNILVARYDGEQTLMFRAANVRNSQIFEARMKVTMLRREVTAEGVAMRRLVDMTLVRDTNPMFILTWLVMHRIDATSPLHGVDLLSEDNADLEFTAIMTGLDATTSSTVHARYAYGTHNILIDHLFDDVVLTTPNGKVTIDYSRLHDVRSVAVAAEPLESDGMYDMERPPDGQGELT